MPVEIATERYFSAEFARREWDAVFRRAWLLVAHVSDLAAPGDFVTTEVGPQPLLLTRDGERVRAFHNVCPHRGSVLCPKERGRATDGRLRCGYHGWEWSVGGALEKAPGAGALPENLRLSELACEVRAGFVFVSLAERPEPLDEYLAEVLPGLRAYRPELYTRVELTTLELACNWKTSADVSNEAYHLRTIHPELLGFVDVDRIRVEELGRHSHVAVAFGLPSRDGGAFPSPALVEFARGLGVEVDAKATPETVRASLARAARARDARDGLPPRELADDQLVDRHQFHVFPNVQVNFFTGRHIDLYRHRPGADASSTVFDWERYDLLPPGTRKVATRRRGKPGELDVGEVMQADLDVLPRLQRGLASNALRTFLTTPLERPIAHMHAVLDRYLREAEEPAG